MLHTLLRSSARLSSTTTRQKLSQLPFCATLNRSLSQQARNQIQSAITATPLVLFMKGTPQAPQCGFSRAVVQVLDLHGVHVGEKMKTFDVLADEELRSGIKEFSEWPTVPQVYVNGEFVGGCDIVLGMHQSGELEELLEKHDVIPKVQADPDVATPPSSLTSS